MTVTAKDKLAWFERLVEQEYDSVRAVCGHLVSACGLDKSFGEDLAQDVFYIARVKLDTIYDHPKPKAWLYMTANYACRELRRKQLAQHLSDDAMLAITDPNAESAVTAWIPSDQYELVADAVSKLSTSDQLLFSYIYHQGYDYAALCKAGNVKYDTMRKRVYRMHTRLGKILKKLSKIAV